MDDNQDFHGTSPDLYEEILAYESLDPYEGLLNRSKSTRADLKHSTKEFHAKSILKTDLPIVVIANSLTIQRDHFCTAQETF